MAYICLFADIQLWHAWYATTEAAAGHMLQSGMDVNTFWSAPHQSASQQLDALTN